MLSNFIKWKVRNIFLILKTNKPAAASSQAVFGELPFQYFGAGTAACIPIVYPTIIGCSHF